MLAEMWLLLSALIPVFALVVVGWALRRFRLVSDQGVEDINNVVFWVALPAQLFVLVAGVDIYHSFDGRTLGTALGGFIAGLVGSWWCCRGLPPAVRGTIVAGVARPNAAFVGMPVIQLLAAALPPEEAKALLTAFGVLLGAMITAFNAGSVLALRFAHHGLSFASLLTVLANLPRNPLIVACALGTLASFVRPDLLKGSVPGDAISLLARAAVPIALLLVGMQLDLGLMRRSRALLAAVALGKLVLVPAATYGIGLALGVQGPALTAAVVLMACPIAIAAAPMSRLLGGDGELMSAMVVVTTIAAPVALFVWLLILR
jgi:predicted permease